MLASRPAQVCREESWFHTNDETTLEAVQPKFADCSGFEAALPAVVRAGGGC